jgi:plastocyanin
MRSRIRPAAALAVLALLAAVTARGEGAETGAIRGRVELGVVGARLADVGPIVAYLDAPEEGGRLAFAVPREVPQMRQSGVRFRPELLVVAAGQRVSLPNDDAIYHNVFSFSKLNAFDLGLYPQGESRSVVLRHPGVVRAYCSIHESMSGTILVAPSPWHAVADASGAFEIRGVPPGRYRLWVWNDRLPRIARAIRVAPGEVNALVVALGAEEPAPATPASAGSP